MNTHKYNEVINENKHRLAIQFSSDFIYNDQYKLVEKCLCNGTLSLDAVENMDTDTNITHWFHIDHHVASLLAEKKEAVIRSELGSWWGSVKSYMDNLPLLAELAASVGYQPDERGI